LCVLVDQNNGQSDDTARLVLPIEPLAEKLSAFGFEVYEVDGGDPGSVLSALERFKQHPRGLRPVAVICRTSKGYGGYANVTNRHKAVIDDAVLDAELSLLAHTRAQMVRNVGQHPTDAVRAAAEHMGYVCQTDTSGQLIDLVRTESVPKVHPARPRDKVLQYDASKLPVLDPEKLYAAGEIVKQAAAAFAADPRFYTIDADLSNASLLYDGASATNRTHAVNAGIAECVMMCMAEGLAIGGSHVWTSTFPPFFDLRALRRIAVSYQERAEAIADPKGWLQEGHNLDVTFLATNANLDGAVNGATHMGNDDMQTVGQIAHVKIIDVSCPQQLLSVCRWLAGGNRGLVYLRVMRNPSRVLYRPDYEFTYGKGYLLHRGGGPGDAVIVSGGRGVLEALAAAELLEKDGVGVSVIDMPSFDGAKIAKWIGAGHPVLFAEQNNGYLYDCFARYALAQGITVPAGAVRAVNTRGADGALQFVHSGTYEQLIEAFGLDKAGIAGAVRNGRYM